MRRNARLTAVLAGAMALSVLPAVSTGVVKAGPPIDLTGAIPVGVAQLAQTLTDPLTQALQTTDAPLRVALISSGVDGSVLPKSLQGQITAYYGSSGDPLGYGTYAASEILQVAPKAGITSIGVFPGGKFSAGWQQSALQFVAQHTKSFDAVLLAVPPSEYLDPVSAELAAGTWNDTTDAITDSPLQGTRGPVFAAPLDGSLRGSLQASTDAGSARSIGAFADRVSAWNASRALVQKINAAGLSVVSPAGDLGPNPQTIFGLANLPEVIAVGGYDGHGVSATSSSGPSIDGHVKPDLIASTGLVGLLPQASALAKSLSARGALDGTLEPVWQAGEPLTSARSRLDTSMSGAAVVAVAVANLFAGGITDAGRQRATLTAASVPLGGVPVWRQGDGLLRVLPDAAFANSHALFLRHLDLGAEPESGAWSATAEMLQGTVTAATTTLTDFMGVGPTARPVIGGNGTTPPTLVTVTNKGVTVNVPAGVLGDDSYQGGLYCGYTEVSVPGSGGGVSPGVDVNGIPQGTEQLPTCLVKGSQLTAHAFFIHAQNTPDETFGLLPALPPGTGMLNRPLEMLPVNPLDTKLYFKVTDSKGDAHFPNIIPGYYRIKEFSDYGAPLTQTVTGSRSGQAVQQSTDVGENPGYQAMEALILSPVCTHQTAPPPDAPDPCSQAFLDQAFGSGNVSWDKTTQTYDVSVGTITFKVAFDHFKKLIGVAVSSRYVDLLSQPDFKWVSSSLGQATKLNVLDALPATRLPAWTFSPAAAPTLSNPTSGNTDCMQATLNPLAVVGQNQWGTVGIASMPFNMTTPNYKMHMSLNFAYDLTNALVIPVVQVGDEFSVGVVSSTGGLRLSDLTGNQGVPDLTTIQGYGHSTGVANFELHHKPKGLSQGTLYFIFLPPADFSSVRLNASPISAARICNASFELDTWTNTLWPATHFPVPNPSIDLSFPNTSDQLGTYGGHQFAVSSNRSAAQMDHPACRQIDNGQVKAPVCQGWEVFVHAPKANASVFDLVSKQTSMLPALSAAGGHFFDPRRGVADFSTNLAFATPSTALFEANLDLAGDFKTNGAFWEVMKLPDGFNSLVPTELKVQIQDLKPEEPGGVLPRSIQGGADVIPYVPYIAHDVFVTTATLISNP